MLQTKNNFQAAKKKWKKIIWDKTNILRYNIAHYESVYIRCVICLCITKQNENTNIFLNIIMIALACRTHLSVGNIELLVLHRTHDLLVL